MTRVLPLDPMPSAKELRAMARKRGVLPHTDTQRPQKAVSLLRPYRSKWEREYGQYLDVLKVAIPLFDWAYEPDRLEIGVGAFYKPDFRIYGDHLSYGQREYREVKGYRREAAMVRLKAAALRYPDYRFFLVTKKRGQWHHQLIQPLAAGAGG